MSIKVARRLVASVVAVGGAIVVAVFVDFRLSVMDVETCRNEDILQEASGVRFQILHHRGAYRGVGPKKDSFVRRRCGGPPPPK